MVRFGAPDFFPRLASPECGASSGPPLPFPWSPVVLLVGVVLCGLLVKGGLVGRGVPRWAPMVVVSVPGLQVRGGGGGQVWRWWFRRSSLVWCVPFALQGPSPLTAWWCKGGCRWLGASVWPSGGVSFQLVVGAGWPVAVFLFAL